MCLVKMSCYFYETYVFFPLAFISWHLAFYPASVPDPVKTEMLQRIHSFLASTATWCEKALDKWEMCDQRETRRWYRHYVLWSQTSIAWLTVKRNLMEINSCSWWLKIKDISPIYTIKGHNWYARHAEGLVVSMINCAVVKTLSLRLSLVWGRLTFFSSIESVM